MIKNEELKRKAKIYSNLEIKQNVEYNNQHLPIQFENNVATVFLPETGIRIRCPGLSKIKEGLGYDVATIKNIYIT
ncbi:MAG: hypothetical protein P857_1077 [Candidatus Xenolissoclinum pacificiensis L6]|uniref:Uncharacterized protein n=1 Tax=Candidatus Xenolissoclinum pacificiensis L6 TaxID=1401685 RepID=W2V2L0_9RICK|nr:MAG: hypothetical protein P857_1077 [Candidatus Xenolissoclinum pacificiensis L6]